MTPVHLQVILSLMQGRGVAETARLTGFGERWVRQFRALWNRFGPASLGDRRGHGSAPRLLTLEVLARLEAHLAVPPEVGGVWSGPKVAAFLAAEHGLSHVAPQRDWEDRQEIDQRMCRQQAIDGATEDCGKAVAVLSSCSDSRNEPPVEGRQD